MTNRRALEAVARAICANGFDGYDPDELVTHKPPPDQAEFEAIIPEGYSDEGECWYLSEGERMWHWKRWRLYIPQAFEAIWAMRGLHLQWHSLTPEMIEAGASALEAYVDGPPSKLENLAREVWTSMERHRGSGTA